MERRAAFVSGASQGIGAAVARALAREGFDLALSSRRVEKLAPLAAELEAAGARVLALALDVLSQSSIERAMAEAAAAFRGLEVLVNNAGAPLRRPALELTAAEWSAVIDVNVSGTFFMSRELARHLVARARPGVIINLASTHGLVGLAGRVAYGTAKGAIIQMTRMLAIEWAPHGIRVNAIAPGRVDTPARAPSLAQPGYREAMLARIPLGRFGRPEEVAAAACYLASPQAAYITGQTLVLDGGLTAQ